MNVLRFGGVNVGGLLLISFPLGLLWGHCTGSSTDFIFAASRFYSKSCMVLAQSERV